MSTFSGSYRQSHPTKLHTDGKGNGRGPRGVMRDRRAEKRDEAEQRNAGTLHRRTRAHREGRCAEHVSVR